MVITKTQLMVLLVSLTGLLVVARLGLIVDLMLLAIAGGMLAPLLSDQRLPKRIRWVMLAFLVLFLIYLALTFLSPSMLGIVNVVGIAISGIFFLYFSQNAEKLIGVRNTGGILMIAGIIICVTGAALNLVSKNTTSGVSAYFFLSAGVVWVAQGHSLMKVTLIMFLALSGLGVILGHRMMLGAAFVMLVSVVLFRLVPLAILRNFLLIVIFSGIVLMFAMFAKVWGLDVRDFDAIFVEYTGRTARSGRQIIWPMVIAATAQSPLTGLGTGMTFSRLYEVDWSAHSYFLQIYMQAGLLGLVGLGAVLFSVWGAIGRPRRSQPVRLITTGGFLVMLLHASAEVFLMQVNLLMGCSAWMMLGLGIGAIQSITKNSYNFDRSKTDHALFLSSGNPV